MAMFGWGVAVWLFLGIIGVVIAMKIDEMEDREWEPTSVYLALFGLVMLLGVISTALHLATTVKRKGSS